MSAKWYVNPYERRDGDAQWTEWAVDDAEGRPIATGIQVESIAHQIALLPVAFYALREARAHWWPLVNQHSRCDCGTCIKARFVLAVVDEAIALAEGRVK